MTKNELQKIVEEYIENCNHSVDLPVNIKMMLNKIEKFAEYLNEHYFIIKKSDIKKEYNKLKQGIYCSDMQTTRYVAGCENTYKKIFGADTLI